MTSEITSFQNGRYQVLRKLGEGGKGIVFLCQDTVLGRRVAIKVLKEEVLDAEGLLRFQREVQAMASLVHPNVVTVFDIGQEGPRHYLVLELMEGGDVEHLIASAPNQRLNAATSVRIGKEVARALEHAHLHSILHRDVKPGNIWLTKEGVAKLGDFGLAYLGGGPRLTQAGMMVGSIAYMAPEVALGRPADARSDLYMLGASLYEMATGRVPFPGDDPVRVLFSHINDLPLAPRRFAPDIPDALEALILRLLSKDPEQRPASATDVLRALEEVERTIQGGPAAAVGATHASPLQTAHPPTPEPRFAQPLVGRERELDILRQRVDAALRGEGSLVFLTGEAGIGKTRMAWEVRPYARGRGFLWLEGHYPREGSIPSQPWVEAIRAFLRTAPPSLLMKVLLPYGAELARLVPEVAERLGRVPAAPSIGPEEERVRLFEALSGFFVGIAREQPLALFLDDLQWAPSLDTLHHLARSMASERLLVVGSYRDAELMEKDPLARTLLALNRERLFHSLSLKRLGQGEVARMVTQTLGQEASAKLADTVYQKTEGNPFFVEEVVRYLADSGAITLGDRGWEVRDSALMQMPMSVKAVVGERLERLGEEARGVLAWASVVGPEFTLPLLQEVTGLEEEKLLDAVEKALAARVFTPRPSLGQEAYAFADNQTREVLYEGISPVRRRRYHLKVGQGIEKVHPRRLEEHYDALAQHFLEGNDLEKAAEYSIKAGDRAAGIYSWERAIGHYQTALELLEELQADPRQQAGVLEKLGMVITFTRGVGGERYWQKALAVYELIGDVNRAAEVHLNLARRVTYYGTDPSYPVREAYIHSQQAVALLEPQGTSALLAQAYTRWALYHWGTGGVVSEAQSSFEKALEMAEKLSDMPTAIEASRLLARLLIQSGHFSRATELYQRSWERAEKTGDAIALAEISTTCSHDHSFMRHPQVALHWAEQATEQARRAGTLRANIYSHSALALARTLLGDTTGALSTIGEVERIAGRDLNTLAATTPPQLCLGFLVALLRSGDGSETEEWLARVLKSFSDPSSIASRRVMAQVIEDLYLERSELGKARAVLEPALPSFIEIGASMPLLAVSSTLASVCALQGEVEPAQAHLRRAQEILSNGEDWRGLAAEVHLAEGILATAQRHWPEAEAAFQKAVDINRRYHLPYYEARSLLEWGEMYLARNHPGDRQQGMELLDQALAIFQRIQAKKMVEKVLARKEPLGA